MITSVDMLLYAMSYNTSWKANHYECRNMFRKPHYAGAEDVTI